MALVEVLKACKPRGRHLLTGPAGTGKTWPMRRATRDVQEKREKAILTATTEKAVAVLVRKMIEDANRRRSPSGRRRGAQVAFCRQHNRVAPPLSLRSVFELREHLEFFLGSARQRYLLVAEFQ